MDTKGLCSNCDQHFTDSLSNLDGTLMIAAWRGHVNCVQTMIEAGANVNSTALTSAVIKGRDECVNLLLEAGADVNTQRNVLCKAAAYGQDKCLDLLLKAGADVNKAGCDGSTALTASAKSGNRECLELLITAGADVNTRTKCGDSVLRTAVKYQHVQCVEAILRARALVNIPGELHSTLTSYIVDREEPDQKLCMLLFAAGERVLVTSEGNLIFMKGVWRMGVFAWEDCPVPKFLIQVKTRPGLCLKEKCREVIRRRLLHLNNENLFIKVTRLGLPTPLTKYFLYGF